MTLFTYRDLWSLDINEPPSFISPRAVVAANVDNNPDDESVLVVGSLSGYLRIIGAVHDVGGGDEDYAEIIDKAAILAEFHLTSPILQVEAERFVGGSDNITLAILHPLKLSIFSVSKLPGQVEHGSQYKLSLLYEHQLKRHAFNMVGGPFGRGTTGLTADRNKGVKEARQFLCVQSLDGTLSFFEQEVFTFSRYIPDILLPGQLAYVPSWDSFIIAASWNLICFKYASLAMAKDDVYQQQAQDSTVGKKLIPDWVVTLGEECLGEIQVLGTEDASTTRIIVCTFRNIYCFGEAAELKWCKKLEYHINSFCSYVVRSCPTDNQQITLAASGNDPFTCYIYNGTALRWAAKLPICPVFISKVSLNGVDGGVLILNSEGKLILGYLGTEPSLFVAPPVQSRDLDYEAAEKELQHLRKIITEVGESNSLVNKDGTVEIKVEFEGHKTKWLESGLEVIALIGKIKILCRLRVNDLRVTISTPPPISCNTDSVYVGDIIGRHTLPLELFVSNLATPSDLQCDISVFYVSDSGSPHFAQKSGVKIPLFVVAKVSEYIEKDADCKLTFSLNKPSVNLVQLYNDFEWNEEANATCICFKFYDGVKVTVLSSTKTNTSTTSKYRIQSNIIAGIYIIYRDFVDRLQRKYGRENSDFRIEVAGPDNEIPFLTEYFGELDAHLLRKERDIQIKADLADRAAQLRAVQRRLLLRFRDKNPVPLTQLEILMDGSLDQITDCLNFIENNQEEMYKSECRLSGATHLLIELMLVKGGKRSDEAIQISNAFCPFVWSYTDEFGWEEAVYTALTFLKSQVISTQSAGAKLESKKLKKVIKSVLEKVGKGSTVDSSPSVDNAQVSNSGEKKGETLIGNEIQERMTSARGRRTRPHNPVLDTIPEPIEAEEPDSNKSYPQQPPLQESASASPEETNNLVALRDTYEQELLTDFRRGSSSSIKKSKDQFDDDDGGGDDDDLRSSGNPLGYQNYDNNIANEQQQNDTPFLEEYLPRPNNYARPPPQQQHQQHEPQQKSPPPPPNKLLIDAHASSTSENIISDENFW